MGLTVAVLCDSIPGRAAGKVAAATLALALAGMWNGSGWGTIEPRPHSGRPKAWRC